MLNRFLKTLLFGFTILAFVACQKDEGPDMPTEVQVPGEEPFEKLSQYGIYNPPMKELNPREGLIPYTLNNTLFSDFALKKRFVYIPEGKQATYREDIPLMFPNGTMLIKNFFYQEDERDPNSPRNLIETRIIRKHENEWSAETYVWNDQETEAKRMISGEIRKVEWINEDGEQLTAQYMIPNKNECQGCHEYKNELTPIGPRPRHMNRQNTFSSGQENQLSHMKNKGVLKGLPAISNVPKLPKWDDPSTGSIEDRARAYLDINCGYCHNPNGDADNSALHLEHDVQDKGALGVCKRPVAAGGGSGGLTYDIVPGKPDSSILLHRMKATNPNIRMPEIGRSVVHEEAVSLIRQWISEMDGDCS